MLRLAGLALAIAVVLLFRSKNLSAPPGPNYMLVISPKKDGWGHTREWVKIKEPDLYPSHGAAQLGSYVQQVFESKSAFPSLSIFTQDGERGAALWRKDGGLSIHLIFAVPKDAKREAIAREFFESHQIAVMDDYLDGPKTTRLLSWWVVGTSIEITALCQTVLLELCEVGESEGLAITFDEHDLTTR